MSAPLLPPLAVLGTACRLPGGARSLTELAALLATSDDPIREPEAWRGFGAVYHPVPGTPGKTYLRQGGFLEGLRRFDPEMFDLSPREAASLDPQQRLLLEVSREVLGNAAYRAEELAAMRTGVFVGLSGSEYKVLAQRRDPSHIDPYIGTGVHGGTAAGRIAYGFGWRGPAMAIDTACSSGLVALHMACQALWSGEVDAALVAAVNVLLDPEAHVSMSAMGTLSRSARCRSFSSQADGYIRSEGCVGLLLRRADEVAGPVVAHILATASNHDGRSNGLTAPRKGAQVEVIQRALGQAGLTADDVGYHEAHGSATPLGDAVELGALEEVYGGRERPLAVGSVKTRVGHLEAAAGLAGLLQALVVCRTGRVPSQLHTTPESAEVAASTALRVVHEAEPLDGQVVTVSSFGIGGTNAHVVLRRVDPVPAVVPPGPPVWLLSGRREQGIRDMAEQTVALDVPWASVLGSAARSRDAAGLRGAVVASSREQARAALPSLTLTRGGLGRLAWVFPGQGGPRGAWAQGTGQAVVDEALAQVAEVADPLLPSPLGEALRSDAPLDMRFLQPAVFAVSWALSQLLGSWGLRPEVVGGHSSGELAAATVAGVLSMPDAVRLLVARGQVLHASPVAGMTVVDAPLQAIEAALVEGVGLAAFNHAHETVLSGPVDGLAQVEGALEAQGHRARRLPVDRAGHSGLLEGHEGPLSEALASVTLRPPTVPFLSSLTGELLDRELTDPAYWLRQLREPVRFDRLVSALADHDLDGAVELGPHPVLLSALATEHHALGSLQQGVSDEQALAQLVGKLFVAGAPLELAAVFPGPTVRQPLPLESLVEEEHWLSGLDQAASSQATVWVASWQPVVEAADAAVQELVQPPDQTVAEAVGWAVGELKDRFDGPPLQWRVQEGLAGAAVRGVVRCGRHEHPALGGGVVAGPGAGAAGEDVVDGQRLRLATLEAPLGAWSTHGRWLVTGGFGALGRHTAEWLVARGATSLVLMGRSGAGQHEAWAASLGVPVQVAVGDVAVVDDLAAAVGEPLEGVIHAAGVLADAALHAIEPAQIDTVLRPKVDGLAALEACLGDDVLLVAFSSFAGTAGGAGQAVYAAANAVLDEGIAQRVARGGRGLSVAWGPWQGEGLAAATLADRAAQGLPPMAPEAALAGLEMALGAGVSWAAVVDLDPSGWGVVPPLLGALARGQRELDPANWQEHLIDGAPVVSGADQLVWLLEQAPAWQGLSFVRPLRLDRQRRVRIDESGVHSDLGQHLVGTVAPGESEPASAEPWPREAPAELDALYATFRARGLEHGEAYRRLSGAWSQDAVHVGDLATNGSDGERLDAALVLSALGATGDGLLLPSTIEHVQQWRPVAQAAAVKVTVVSDDADGRTVDALLVDADGQPVLALRGYRFQRVGATAGLAAELTGLPREQAVARLATWIAARAGNLVGASAPPVDTDLSDAGLDSIMGVELRNALAAEGLDAPLHLIVGGQSSLVVARGVIDAGAVVADEVAAPVEADVVEAVADGPGLDGQLIGVAGFVGAVLGAGLWALLGWLGWV